MANHTGSEGTVKVGSNTIAEIRSFSIDETHDVDLEQGVCGFEETEFAEEDADPKAHGYLEY
ncbi:MAG: hypothetical protein VCF08_09260 [Alphaproteobacteria bacterium]